MSGIFRHYSHRLGDGNTVGQQLLNLLHFQVIVSGVRLHAVSDSSIHFQIGGCHGLGVSWSVIGVTHDPHSLLSQLILE